MDPAYPPPPYAGSFFVFYSSQLNHRSFTLAELLNYESLRSFQLLGSVIFPAGPLSLGTYAVVSHTLKLTLTKEMASLISP
jgi:hypothetical protein